MAKLKDTAWGVFDFAKYFGSGVIVRRLCLFDFIYAYTVSRLLPLSYTFSTPP